jgi:coenzyme F420-reducing hydrogenase delta subunit/ferredoxin
MSENTVAPVTVAAVCDRRAEFEPKIVAFVCNWCTYLGADLAGTTRLEYPPNVRIIRLPCTGRIDFNLIIKAFEMGADSVLVSGCHPGDCHYTSGNYHARRRWILFRELLQALGFDLERIQFAWISAAEGHKWQQVVKEITEKTRKLGPYNYLGSGGSISEVTKLETPSSAQRGSVRQPTGKPPAFRPAPGPSSSSAQAGRLSLPACAEEIVEGMGPAERRSLSASRAAEPQVVEALRETCRRLLAKGSVKVVIGYGKRGPVFVTRPENVEQLVWNEQRRANLTVYLKRQEIRTLGRAAIVVKGCDERALVVLEKESQIERKEMHVIGMACPGMGEAKCETCEVHVPRFADEVIGEADKHPAETGERWKSLEALLALPTAGRMAYWAREFERCVKCYACRQVCPMCYCERCLVEKNRPTEIEPSPTIKGNFAWHILRAFHLAGRCVGCDECTRACPAGIDLRLLNLSLVKAAEEHFGYRAGMDPKADLLIGAYSLQDKENFIR